jgi:DNA primase
MDVIALHKAGFTSAAASMGTALTYAQAKMLKSLCDNVYISFDGDSAGQKATLRGLDILESEGLNVKVVVLPEGLDPDDVVNKRGPAEYKKLMDSALPLPAFKIESLTKAYDLTAPDGKSAFAVEAVKVIKALTNPVEREEYIRIIHKYTGYSVKVLYSQADLVSPEDAPPPPPAAAIPARGDDAAKTAADSKEFILAALAADKPYVELSEDLYSLLGDDESRRLLSVITEARRRPNYSPGQLYSFVGEEDETAINRLVNYPYKQGDDAKKYRDMVNNLKLPLLEAEVAEVKRNYAESRDDRLLITLNQLLHRINDLKRKE